MFEFARSWSGPAVAALCGAALLAAAPARADYVTAADGTKIYYRTAGHGPVTLLFVEGWMATTDAYDKEFAHFADSDKVTFVSFDMRGQGKSGTPLQGYDMVTKADDIEAVLDAVGNEKVAIGGWSWGSLDAMSWIEHHGKNGRLAGALILDGPVKVLGAEKPGAWGWYDTDDDNGWRQAYSMGPMGDYEGYIKESAGGGMDNPTAADTAFFAAMMHQTSPLVALATNEIGAYVDFTPTAEWAAQHVPFLVFANAEWGDTAKAWTAAHLPGATFASFGKHAFFYEYPDRFNAVLDTWLQQVAP